MIAELEWAQSYAQQNIQQLQNPSNAPLHHLCTDQMILVNPWLFVLQFISNINKIMSPGFE